MFLYVCALHSSLCHDLDHECQSAAADVFEMCFVFAYELPGIVCTPCNHCTTACVVPTDAVLRPDEGSTRQQALGHALKQGLMAVVSVYIWSLGRRAALIKDAEQAWLISYQPRKSKGKC